jgi:hypothetical protein
MNLHLGLLGPKNWTQPTVCNLGYNRKRTLQHNPRRPKRHCEERSDAAIQKRPKQTLKDFNEIMLLVFSGLLRLRLLMTYNVFAKIARLFWYFHPAFGVVGHSQ